jgi:hypothetical protein
LDNKIYCDSDRQFVIEYMAGVYWLARAEIQGSEVRRSALIGKYRTCREARRAAEDAAGPAASEG